MSFTDQLVVPVTATEFPCESFAVIEATPEASSDVPLIESFAAVCHSSATGEITSIVGAVLSNVIFKELVVSFAFQSIAVTLNT